jgi:hypothetical protein
MLQLIRRWPGNSGRSERGAVATIVAILLAGGVLLGMGALAIDVGQLYWEREELQSGADAAAMAVAKECAKTPVKCVVSFLNGPAGEYADDNATDGASTVSVLCGRIAGSDIPPCPAQPDNLTACLNDPPDGDYVEVRTTTRMKNGSTLLPPTFAQALLGNEGYDGTTVGACARAAFGPPKSATGLAMTISMCEWNASTSYGAAFAEPPPYPPNPLPLPTMERVAYLHTTASAGTCPAGPSGSDTPGGFGWLDDPNANCSAVVSSDANAGGDPGVAVSGPCKTLLENARTNRTVLFVPVFNRVTGTGTNTEYHIAGLAAFVVTGYHLPGVSVESWLTGTKYCKGSDKCVYGYFTQALIPATGSIGGPDLGASIVTLIG